MVRFLVVKKKILSFKSAEMIPVIPGSYPSNTLERISLSKMIFYLLEC